MARRRDSRAHAGYEQVWKSTFSITVTNEKEAVKRLVEVRARKDVRHTRLLNARKAVAAQIDLITLRSRVTVAPSLYKLRSRLTQRSAGACRIFTA